MKDYFFLARSASKARLREAENARQIVPKSLKLFPRAR